MKRYIYLALAAMMVLSGCRYHPFYDGQKLRLYHKDCGLVETDGVHLFVPVRTDEPYALKIYGGKGKKHRVIIDDPEFLDYSYEEGYVKKSGFDDTDIIPAAVTLLPVKTGDTSMTVSDLDSGESITLYVHVCEAYKALEIYDSENSLEKGILLTFRYGGTDDVVRVCKRSPESGGLVHVTDGRYAFVSSSSTVCLELSIPVDESGQPSADGTEVTRRYQVEFLYGGVYGSAAGMMECLRLGDFPVSTKASQDVYDYSYAFQFVDVTDYDASDTEFQDAPKFFVRSAFIIPWIF